MSSKFEWVALEKPISAFTTRNTTMRNLNTGEIIQHYSANTKIAVAEKCVTETGTYYRTASAAHYYLNYAFEAAALGLPNEIAPSAPTQIPFSIKNSDTTSLKVSREKQKSAQKVKAPNDGGEPKPSFWKRFFKRAR